MSQESSSQSGASTRQPRGRIVALGESERKAFALNPRSATDLRDRMMKSRACDGPTDDSFVFLWDFTPEDAAILLDHCNIGNRNIVRSHVEKLKAEAKAGRWYPNVDPIVITLDMKLIGGQHRLTMVRETGISQKFLVVLGVTEEVKYGLDRGKPWSIADKLEADKLAVAGVRLICSMMTGTCSEPRDSEVHDAYDRFGQSAAMVSSISHQRRILACSSSIAAFTLASLNVTTQDVVLDLMRRIAGYSAEESANKIVRSIESSFGRNGIRNRVNVALRILDELASVVEEKALPESEKPTTYGLIFFMPTAKWRVG
jgi:hypothetical protein